MNADGLARLEDIFRLIIGLPDDQPMATLARATEPLWDSLAQVSLVVAIEQEFGITVSLADRAALISFPAAVALVDGGRSRPP
jgi:acyl carrier protein